MFLRHKVRRKDGKEHRYWSIVENRRVSAGRTVQRHVLISERSMTTRAPHGARRSKRSMRAANKANRSRCFLRIGGAGAGLRCGACPAQGLRLRQPRQWGGCWLACQCGISCGWIVLVAAPAPLPAGDTLAERAEGAGLLSPDRPGQ